jgi:hypothetical protein
MKAFVIMPFENKIADDIYKLSTKPICEEFGLEVQRADEIFTANPILDDVLSAIKEAMVIIADISGKNPNVFYELGISHLLKQTQTIMITQDEFDQIPFDISHFRIISYTNTIGGKTAYENQLRLTLQNILRDYKSIYKNEFDLVADVLRRTETDFQLFALMALAEIAEPLDSSKDIDVSGHNEKFEMECTGGYWSSSKTPFANFIMFDYAKIENNMIILTDKGRAFVEVLKEKGYVLDKAKFE